ncbi:MAG: YjbQ family protein [Planctomycetes bacterium]|nr:YjbQ family protein [Planctomycetota bacterium]
MRHEAPSKRLPPQDAGETDVVDLTDRSVSFVREAGVREGLLTLFLPGATGAITTIEFEPGCVRDLQAALERVAPREGHYDHNERWGDGNGFSHVRAALLGPSLTVPIAESRPLLGTWQRIVLVDLDNRPRERQVVVTATGVE